MDRTIYDRSHAQRCARPLSVIRGFALGFSNCVAAIAPGSPNALLESRVPVAGFVIGALADHQRYRAFLDALAGSARHRPRRDRTGYSDVVAHFDPRRLHADGPRHGRLDYADAGSVAESARNARC